MAGNRRLVALLVVLAVTLAAAIYINLPASAPQVAQNPVSVSPQTGRTAAPPVTAPDVHSEALTAARPQPGAVGRNLFKFRPKYVPPAPRVIQAPSVAAPSGPMGPAPPPPIGLKFIGLLEPPAGGRIAILSDGRGAPIYGKEGEALLGQYRIRRIGLDSIELEYLDGRGRQAIRLSGS